jgi:hypothetical protein
MIIILFCDKSEDVTYVTSILVAPLLPCSTMPSNDPGLYNGSSAPNFGTNAPQGWPRHLLQQSHSTQWNSNTSLPQLSPQDFTDYSFGVRF